MNTIRVGSYAVLGYFVLLSAATIYLFLAFFGIAELLAGYIQIIGLFIGLTLGLFGYLRGDLERQKEILHFDAASPPEQSISEIETESRHSWLSQDVSMSFFVLTMFTLLSVLTHAIIGHRYPALVQLAGVILASLFTASGFLGGAGSKENKISGSQHESDAQDSGTKTAIISGRKIPLTDEDDLISSRTQIAFYGEEQASVIASLFKNTQRRLAREIRALERRGITNLVTGVMITAVATATLIFLVTRPHDEFRSVPSVLNFYIPRITTIALVETFAYFFLRLYKSNLEEIKYYQNERTTITALEIAFRASWDHHHISPSGVTVIDRIVKVDRNPVMTDKGKKAADQSELLDMLKIVSKLVMDSAKKKEE